MIRLRFLSLLLVPVTLLLAGCGSADTPAADNVDSSGNQVSSVPWNKPESWETTGQLGQMAQ